MKNIFKRIITGTMVVVLLVGFTIYQSTLVQDKKSLIIGAWAIDNEISNMWIFNSTGCKWEFEGEIIEEFTYTIESSFTESGLEILSLNLTNIGQPSEIYDYEIIGLGDNKVILSTFQPKVSYTHFTRQ